MEKVDFKIEGLREVELALSELSPKLQASIYRALNRKALKKFIVDNLRTTLNYSSLTENRIGMTVQQDRKDPTAIRAGIQTNAYHLRFADMGTALRKTKSGANRGSIIGKNQVQPVIEENVNEIIEFYKNELEIEVKRILEKRLKNVNKQLTKLR